MLPCRSVTMASRHRWQRPVHSDRKCPRTHRAKHRAHAAGIDAARRWSCGTHSTTYTASSSTARAHRSAKRTLQRSFIRIRINRALNAAHHQRNAKFWLSQRGCDGAASDLRTAKSALDVLIGVAAHLCLRSAAETADDLFQLATAIGALHGTARIDASTLTSGAVAASAITSARSCSRSLYAGKYLLPRIKLAQLIGRWRREHSLHA